jgi:hypothetical protein
MWMILFKIAQNKWFWVAIIVIAMLGFIYQLYTENQRLKYEKAKTEQNIAAANDALDKTRDSIKILASSVENLNLKNGNLAEENKKIKNEYRALKMKYDILIVAIDTMGRGNYTSCENDTAEVKFSGKKDIAYYSISTKVFLKTCTSTYDFKLVFDPIDVRSELFLDELDSHWKMRTTSMSPGVILRGISSIDEQTFKKLQGVSPPDSNIRSQVFGIGGMFGSQFVAGGIQIKPNAWEFGMHYVFYDNTKLLTNWYDKLVISVHYFPF